MSRRALVVDDSATMRDMVGYTLKNAGFEVLTATDGEAALSTLGDEPVRLVVTDVNMPRMDGITLTARLRGHPRHKATPILILTTESDAAMKERGKAAGATGWLVKPFTEDRLLQVVAKVCP